MGLDNECGDMDMHAWTWNGWFPTQYKTSLDLMYSNVEVG